MLRCLLYYICGRYEGIDQRFIDHYVDEEISLGDFVLSGGENGCLSGIRRYPALNTWCVK